jgi:hypothetical protein
MKTKYGAILAGIIVLAGFSAFAIAQDDEQYAAVNFLVIRDYNGKPVKNASVIMHPVNRKGKQKYTGFQLKTDTEGKTNFDGIPYGPLRVQVLAQGFQTYGEDYQIDKPQLDITIKLKRPQGQFSIYDDHPEDKKDEKKDDQKTPDKQDQTGTDRKITDKKPQF